MYVCRALRQEEYEKNNISLEGNRNRTSQFKPITDHLYDLSYFQQYNTVKVISFSLLLLIFS